MDESTQIAQAAVDVLTWFLAPFAVVLAIEWVIGLFRRDA